MARPALSPHPHLALALALAALLPAFVALHLATPSDGARIAGHDASSSGIRLDPLDSASLMPGDILLAIDGATTESLTAALTQFERPRPEWSFGQTLTYTILRNGQRLEVPVTLAGYPLGRVLARSWGAFLSAVIIPGLLLFVYLRRPGEPVTRAMLWAGAGMVSSSTWSLGLTVGDLAGRSGFWLYALSSTGAYMLVWAGALHALLLFPSPWAPLQRHRWLAPALYILPYAVLALVSVLAPAPDALAWQQTMGSATGALEAVYVLAAILSAVRSYRTARNPVARAQVRWVVTAFLVVFFSAFALAILPQLLVGQPLVSWSNLALIGLLVPLSFVVAILRYRLFDIDLILNRTLVYGSLTTLIVALYVALVGGLVALLRLQDSLFVSLAVTALVAIAFQPLRFRLQRAVNRLMYGERDEPYAVLTRLSRRLESTLAPDAVLPAIVEAVAQTLKLPYAAITLREAGSDTVAAAFGLPGTNVLALPLMHQHKLVGHLRVGPRSDDEPFISAEMQLLENIARQTGVAVHNVRLTADLQRSRERLVTAREEERRRIRRDLHDGLGPTLASQSYRLDAALDLIDPNPEAAKQVLADLKAQTKATLADIRRLVYELRPPALDELGLVAALQAQFPHSANGLRINVESPREPLPPLSAAVEAAAFRIASEAINNTIRHAQARECVVRFTAAAQELKLEVIDDGQGLADEAGPGVGLQSMRERAAELGGTCIVEPGQRGGTRVTARLPRAGPKSETGHG